MEFFLMEKSLHPRLQNQSRFPSRNFLFACRMQPKRVVKVGFIPLSVERKTLSFTRFFERVGKRVDARAYAFPTASVSSLSFGALCRPQSIHCFHWRLPDRAEPKDYLDRRAPIAAHFFLTLVRNNQPRGNRHTSSP